MKCGNTFWDTVHWKIFACGAQFENSKDIMNAATPAHDSAQSHEHTHRSFTQLTMTLQSCYPSTRKEKGLVLHVGARLQPWIIILYKSHRSFFTINNSMKQLHESESVIIFIITANTQCARVHPVSIQKELRIHIYLSNGYYFVFEKTRVKSKKPG